MVNGEAPKPSDVNAAAATAAAAKIEAARADAARADAARAATATAEASRAEAAQADAAKAAAAKAEASRLEAVRADAGRAEDGDNRPGQHAGLLAWQSADDLAPAFEAMDVATTAVEKLVQPVGKRHRVERRLHGVAQRHLLE